MIQTEGFDGDVYVSTDLKVGRTSVPLQAVSVEVTVKQLVAQVEVFQRFINPDSKPVEAVFTFQQEDVCIYGFEVEIDGKRLTSICKEKEEALNTYDDGIAAGHGAYLLEKESTDSFTLSVGSLPPRSVCTISVKYVAQLSTEDDAYKLRLPITEIPLFGVYPSHPNAPFKFPNGLSLKASCIMSSPVVSLRCETHEIVYELNKESASFSLAGLPTEQPARQFVLLIGVQDMRKPASVLEVVNSKDTHAAVMLSFYPTIESTNTELLMEYVFLVDRSGSMEGTRNLQTRNALQLFLRSIPVGSLFNIVGFGSSFSSLFPESVVYNDSTLEEATKFAASMEANLGGTVIFAPLKEILSKPTTPRFPRQVFILTDGEVDDTEDVIKMTKTEVGSTRIFTLGIGAEASKRLVTGLAKVGRGQVEFVSAGARVEPKVLAQLRRAMQPHVNVEVDWGSLLPNVLQAPAVVPPIFTGEPIVIFGLINRPVTLADDRTTLRISTPEGMAGLVSIPISGIPSSGSSVGILAAATAIGDVEKKLEDKLINQDEAKLAILPLALQFSLVSTFTSLIALESRDTNTQESMEMSPVGYHLRRKLIEPVSDPHATTYCGASEDVYEDVFASVSVRTKKPDIGFEDFAYSPDMISPKTLDYNISRLQFPNLEPSEFEDFAYEPQRSASPTPNSSPIPRIFSPVLGIPITAPVGAFPPFGNRTFTPVSFMRDRRPMDELVVLQQAAGNWAMSETFLDVVGLDKEKATTALGDKEIQHGDICATVFAIAILETQFPESVEEWSLLRDKAIRWVSKELKKGNSLGDNVFILLAKAREFLTTNTTIPGAFPTLLL